MAESGDGDTPDRWATALGTGRSVPEQVEDRLVAMIDAGELAVGDRLPTEPDLARSLKVARSSVRTALQRLQARGVLQVNRGRGWFVSSRSHRATTAWPTPTDVDLLEVMQVRIALEGMAAALAAARCTTGEIDEIAKLNEAHRDADLEDPGALLRTDQEFHEAIVACARNDYLREVYGTVTPLLATWRATSFVSTEVHRRSASDHEQILWQLRRGDEMGARLAMSAHLLRRHDAIEAERARRGSHPSPGSAPGLATFIGDDLG